MYINPQNKEQDKQAAYKFIREHGFATLFSTHNGQPWATHLPLELAFNEQNEPYLHGHMAKANPQWRDIANNELVLAVFLGSHAYISSSWYDHPNVPTWNYVSAHVRGTYQQILGEDLLNHLRHLTDRYEAASEHPVTVDGLPPKLLATDLRGLVAFRILDLQIDMAKKLSQNRNEKNTKSIVQHLRQRNNGHDNAIADLMDITD